MPSYFWGFRWRKHQYRVSSQFIKDIDTRFIHLARILLKDTISPSAPNFCAPHSQSFSPPALPRRSLNPQTPITRTEQQKQHSL
jgi:hypothetical protein